VYEDAGLAQLVAPATDAADLARALAAPATCGFAVDTVIDASSVEVARAVEDFLADRDRADLLVLYFSCHGLKDEQGRLYLAARTTRRDRLRSTALPAGLINDLLLACHSRRKVLILDCCYSGAFAKGMQVKADPQIHTAEQFDARGLVVLTASDAAQYAFEGDAVRGSAARSAFTAALITGLDTGDADVDGDGMVSVDDAHEYVRRRLAEQPRHQSPRKWEFDVQGRIVLARSPRAVAAATAPDRVTAAPPALLPPIPPPAAGATPAIRQPAWWAALALVLTTTAAASWLVGWWALDLVYPTISKSEYLPLGRGPVWSAGAGAGWGVAYAIADAIERTHRPAPFHWYHPHRRWLHALAALAVPTGPRRLRRTARAVAAATPLNVLSTLVLSTAVSALGYGLDGSDTRDHAFNLMFTALTAIPIGAYLRRQAAGRPDPEPSAS
jgi:hypothetical protein